jgi:hypothetical protein
MTGPTAPVRAVPVKPQLSMPDITPAQIAAAATGAIGLAIALGVPLSHDKQLAIETFVTTFAPILILVDAAIRHSRAKYVHTALVEAAGAIAAAQPLAAALVQQGNGEQPAAAPGETQLPPYIR